MTEVSKRRNHVTRAAWGARAQVRCSAIPAARAALSQSIHTRASPAHIPLSTGELEKVTKSPRQHAVGAARVEVIRRQPVQWCQQDAASLLRKPRQTQSFPQQAELRTHPAPAEEQNITKESNAWPAPRGRQWQWHTHLRAPMWIRNLGSWRRWYVCITCSTGKGDFWYSVQDSVQSHAWKKDSAAWKNEVAAPLRCRRFSGTLGAGRIRRPAVERLYRSFCLTGLKTCKHVNEVQHDVLLALFKAGSAVSRAKRDKSSFWICPSIFERHAPFVACSKRQVKSPSHTKEENVLVHHTHQRKGEQFYVVFGARHVILESQWKRWHTLPHTQ